MFGSPSSLPLIENWIVPRGQVYALSDPPSIVAHPSTVMQLKNGGRVPLWTRNMLGVTEAERDKRQRATKMTPYLRITCDARVSRTT